MITIASPAFNDNSAIPRRFSCEGEDINPPLIIDGVPTNTKDLVLIVEDPDALGGTWTHWLLWNIDPTTKKIDEGSAPPGVIFGTNDFNRLEYGGFCPPSGTHRYFFKIYALDSKLDIPEGANASELGKIIEKHIIDEGILTGTYTRGSK